MAPLDFLHVHSFVNQLPANLWAQAIQHIRCYRLPGR